MANNDDGYPKWAKDNTSTVPYDPANEIGRSKGPSSQEHSRVRPSSVEKRLPKLQMKPVEDWSVSGPAVSPQSEQTTGSGGEKQQTITDGDTDVVSSYLGHQSLPQVNFGNSSEKVHLPPCLNPRCKSYGKGHPNCLCYAGPNGSSLEDYSFAKGGVVGERFCSKNQGHNPKCEYYAEGGSIDEAPSIPQVQDNPEDTIGHASIEHGLLGLLQEVGHKNLTNSEKHIETLESVRNGDHKGMYGHPLMGNASPSKIEPIMARLSGPVSVQDHNPQAYRNSVDYLSSAMRGHNSLENHVSELFGKHEFPERIEHDSNSRAKLKNHLDQVQENPQKMLDVGGSLGHYLPEHSASLAAHAAVATEYLNSLKPTQDKKGPLDAISPIDKMAEAKYDRALDIANNPLLILRHAKDGTLLPQDIKTLNTLYPGLHKSMVNKIGKHLIEAKDIEIPYRQRVAVSMLIGQPLDSTMSPIAMQAIIRANGDAQTPQSAPKKASGVELKQINKVNQMIETPTQDRINDKQERK